MLIGQYGRYIAEKIILLRRPFAMFSLQNCDTLSCDRPWKHNLIISDLFIAIKSFSQNGDCPTC